MCANHEQRSDAVSLRHGTLADGDAGHRSPCGGRWLPATVAAGEHPAGVLNVRSGRTGHRVAGARHRCRGGLPPQPDAHRTGSLDARPGDRWSLHRGSGHAGPGPRRAPLLGPVRRAGPSAARVRGGDASDLRGVPGRGEAAVRRTLLLVLSLPSVWSPGPMEQADPPIYIAGVREWMCRMAGATADGMLVHPLSTVAYLDQVVIPAVREGEVKAGRPSGSVAMVCPVMTAVSDDEAVRARAAREPPGPPGVLRIDTRLRHRVRRVRVPGVAAELNQRQREGDIKGLIACITDEMVDTMAITSRWDYLPQALVDRYRGRADDVTCYSSSSIGATTPLRSSGGRTSTGDSPRRPASPGRRRPSPCGSWSRAALSPRRGPRSRACRPARLDLLP